MGDNETIILMGQHIQMNASDEKCSNYKDIIMSEAPREPTKSISMENNTKEIVVHGAPTTNPKEKRPYKSKSTNFPEDVRSLLATNIFNGIPVTYVSWSREKQLTGVIHGTGYICTCKACDFHKIVKSSEFEAHAGCKTKHPNNRIYFSNGKSIHEVVHKLQEAPRENLCEVIEELMEGQVNQVNFRKWKVKYEAGNV